VSAEVRNGDPISLEITAEDVLQGFQRWPEAASTSPPGRHLGQYKAIIQHPYLLYSLVQFMNIAISRGIVTSLV